MTATDAFPNPLTLERRSDRLGTSATAEVNGAGASEIFPLHAAQVMTAIEGAGMVRSWWRESPFRSLKDFPIPRPTGDTQRREAHHGQPQCPARPAPHH